MSQEYISLLTDTDNYATCIAPLGRNSIANRYSIPAMGVTVGNDELKKNILNLEYMRTVISVLPNLAYLKDTVTQQYLYANEGFKRLLVNSAINAPDTINNNILQCEMKAIELNEVITNQKISPLVAADGKLFEFMLSFHPIATESVERKYVLCYGYDITKNISSNSLFGLYKNYYSDEKEALQRFLIAIKLDQHLNGQKLSPREFDCLIMLAKGLSAKEIARVLEISNRTVENHLLNIKIKFSVTSNIELLSIFLSCYRQEN